MPHHLISGIVKVTKKNKSHVKSVAISNKFAWEKLGFKALLFTLFFPLHLSRLHT